MSIFHRYSTSARAALFALVCSLIHMPVNAGDMWQQLFQENLARAEAGEADAQYEVGIMYLKGQGVEQDRGQAVHWLTAASKSGHEPSAAKLRRMEDQQDKFQKLLKKAEAGDTQTQYEVAMMLLKGRGVDKDEAQAAKWLSKAAEQGDEKAITRLGIVNYKGEIGRPDYAKAFDLFSKVKSESVLAQYYLGEMYAEGKGVKRDYQEAIAWYQKAADGGFNRAHGKIINLEEEIEIQKRRAVNAEQQAQREKVAVAAQPKPAPVKAPANKVVAKVETPQKPVKKSVKKTTPPPRKASKSPLERLADSQWTRRGKPVEYLPSQVARCDMEKKRLVCFSEVMNQTRGNQIVQYRVKSLISPEKNSFAVTYRNLVLDVTSIEVTDDDDKPLGWDGVEEQGYRIKTGWTKEHNVTCSFKSSSDLDCVKDNTYKLSIVEGIGETKKVAR
jgi:TPR repeat protein